MEGMNKYMNERQTDRKEGRNEGRMGKVKEGQQNPSDSDDVKRFKITLFI